MSRFLSRKFITTVAAQSAALLVLIWPEQQTPIFATIDAVAALTVALGSMLGYVSAESSIDRARVQQPDGRPAS